MSASNNSHQEVQFGTFRINTGSIFYQSERGSTAFVNLRPIVPGHVLVIPKRIVATMEELDEDEYLDVWISVRLVQKLLKAHYDCEAFNVAIQDGRAAGQSVPHVHVHVLPRTEGDYENNDDIYAHLEDWAPRDELQNKPTLEGAEDSARRDRSIDEMHEEAAIYRSYHGNI